MSETEQTGFRNQSRRPRWSTLALIALVSGFLYRKFKRAGWL